jgi:hypothetical protein
MVFKKEDHKNYHSTAKQRAYTKYYKSEEMFLSKHIKRIDDVERQDTKGVIRIRKSKKDK